MTLRLDLGCEHVDNVGDLGGNTISNTYFFFLISLFLFDRKNRERSYIRIFFSNVLPFFTDKNRGKVLLVYQENEQRAETKERFPLERTPPPQKTKKQNNEKHQNQ